MKTLKKKKFKYQKVLELRNHGVPYEFIAERLGITVESAKQLYTYAKHRERIIPKRQKYYQKNKEKINKYSKWYNETFKEELKMKRCGVYSYV